MHICIYTYTYLCVNKMHIYTFTHTHTYIYIEISAPPPLSNLTLLDLKIFHFYSIKYWNAFKHTVEIKILIFFMAMLEKSPCVPGI